MIASSSPDAARPLNTVESQKKIGTEGSPKRRNNVEDKNSTELVDISGLFGNKYKENEVFESKTIT